MGTIKDFSHIVNLATNDYGQDLYFSKDNRVAGATAVTPVAGRWNSMWQYEGSPGAGSAPTTWTNPTNATAGALVQTDPSGGRQLWMLGLTSIASTQSGLLLYDRLGHNGNLDGTTTTNQTFTGSITRNTSGVGNQIFVEIYTQIGTTATTATVSYTNQDGNSATTPAFSIGGTNLREAQRMIPVPLAAGDYGVQAVSGLDLLASTTTAGAFGVTVAQPLAYVHHTASGNLTQVDFLAGLPSFPEISSGACLSLAWIANTTALPRLYGSVHLLEA